MRFAAFFLACLGVPLWAQVSWHSFLPPLPPWDQQSKALMVGSDDPWQTPAEATGLKDSPNYADTMVYLRRLVAAAPELSLTSIGKSHQGRDIWLVTAAKGHHEPEALKASGKPIILAQAGIHAGEIDGKDAGLMLLRDMTVANRKSDLLDKVNLLFIPILNVDGHERTSAYSRINQRGPANMGWRTNARNQNLNRDYGKLDTPETRAVVALINRYQPDLYIDLHVTDGKDYQADITYCFNILSGNSPRVSAWLEETYRPNVDKALRANGHKPALFAFSLDKADPSKGILHFAASIRYSNGYGDMRHLPTILVENHSLKPYDQRVLGTYLFLEHGLRTTAAHWTALQAAITADRQARPNSIAVAFRPEEAPQSKVEYEGVAWKKAKSQVTGQEYVVWTGQPETVQMPYMRMNQSLKIPRPAGYWVGAEWSDLIERLAVHGIQMQRLTQPRKVTVQLDRIVEYQLAPDVFEGHVRVSAKTASFESERVYPAGSVFISTDQPLGNLAVALLEPTSPESFFQWGMMHEVLQRTEYFENYIMEPMANHMLQNDPELKAAFEQKLAEDAEFADNPQKRLEWFYEKTPFFDQQFKVFPIGRVLP